METHPYFRILEWVPPLLLSAKLNASQSAYLGILAPRIMVLALTREPEHLSCCCCCPVVAQFSQAAWQCWVCGSRVGRHFLHGADCTYSSCSLQHACAVQRAAAIRVRWSCYKWQRQQQCSRCRCLSQCSMAIFSCCTQRHLLCPSCRSPQSWRAEPQLGGHRC